MAKKENTRKYLLHELAHAYLRLALKTNNNRIKGALYASDGFYFNDHYDQSYMCPVSLNNIYNVLAETLDSIEGRHRFTNSFAVYNEMSTLPGYDFFRSSNRDRTMLDSFNIYGLITLYAFNKEILYNYHNNRDAFEDAVENACEALKSMDIIPVNPSKITTIDSMSTNRATSVIKKSEKIDKAIEKKKAELYLTLYFYNKTDNKAIFGKLNDTYRKFLDENELTPKQTDQLLTLTQDVNHFTNEQLNFIITCNIDNASISEILDTPSLFTFNENAIVKKNGVVNVVDMKFEDEALNIAGFKNSQIELTPTYMYTSPDKNSQEPLYLNNNGEYCYHNGDVYTGHIFEIDKQNNSFIDRGHVSYNQSQNQKPTNLFQQLRDPANSILNINTNYEYADNDEPAILVDQDDFPVFYQNGKYYYQDGSICNTSIFEKIGDDLSPYDDQEEVIVENTPKDDGREKY